MRLATPAQVREADRLTIERGLVPSLQLMENAGEGAARISRRLLGDSGGSAIVVVFAGKGNNGGDAFVVARYLKEWGARVRVFVTADPDQIRGDAQVNLGRWRELDEDVVALLDERATEELGRVTSSADLVIDGIFGTGFRGDAGGVEARVIACINDSEADVLALDIPSGVDGATGAIGRIAVRASVTATFAVTKTGLVLEPGRAHAGLVDVVDIGIPESVLDEVGIVHELSDAGTMRALLPRRAPDAHKGDAGRVYVYGGSRGMSGAVVLSSCAALRAGAGLVTSVVPESLHDVLESSVTEAITFPVEETDEHSHTHRSLSAVRGRLADADAVVVGPGLSRHPEALVAVRHLVRELTMPVVLDADGLFAFTDRLESVSDAAGPRVLTPHPGEASRLLGVSAAEVRADVFASAQRLGEISGATVVLKGGPTLVRARSGRVTVNSTGNAGMATGGSGDVLSGVIAALLAQGLDPDDAARLGVYLHGLAGDIAADRLTEWSLVAGDLVDLLPEAFYALDRDGDAGAWF